MIRTHCFEGDPYDAGCAVGRAVGERLRSTVERLIGAWPARDGVVDRRKLDAGAGPWLARLPERYRDEIRGLADGAGMPPETLAAGYYAEECCCSAFITTLGDGHLWAGRNNDAFAPELWNGVTIHAIDGRIPRVGFGVEADTFTTAGVNRERLLLHYNSGPADDVPSGTKPCFQPHVVMTEALETCTTIREVEHLLDRWERTRGMILFAVDARRNEGAVLECGCRTHRRRGPGRSLVGTNHHEGDAQAHDGGDAALAWSVSRGERAGKMLDALPRDAGAADLQRILGDDGVEQRTVDRMTVFSTVICPKTGEMWFACGSGPAASAGAWARVDWPW